MAGIYIHIPFCKQACHYCDFHFSTNVSNRTLMVEAVARELSLQRKYLGEEPVKTIYFGGGTPSLLTLQELDFIFSAVNKNFRVSQHTEVTLEANPDDLTIEKLKDIRSIGVNRLSIGIQSFDDAVLKYLNRPHSAAEALRCMELSREANFNNISIDLIYAIPGQPDEQWRKNIGLAIALQPEHISAYSLTIEKKTAFGNWYEKGKLIPVKDDLAANQLDLLVDALTSAGYEQYEVSNFSKPGFESRHNSNYWRQEKYLGVGPGAHSYDGRSRQFNVKNNSQYIASINNGSIPFDIEVLSPEDRINEYLLTTLRTSWGSDLELLKNSFNYNLLELHATYVNLLIDNKLAVIENAFFKLTRKGRLLADKISSDLFLET
jgi:oxygen-independent coproporphyrinogen-3 oxidase